jgi:ferrous iron transport protein A
MQLDVATMFFQRAEIKQSTFGISLKMQAGVKKSRPNAARNLTELRQGEQGVLAKIDLPEDDARRLMELGFVPGHTIIPAQAAPGGDPRVFRVDGTEVALRRETALKMLLKP